MTAVADEQHSISPYSMMASETQAKGTTGHKATATTAKNNIDDLVKQLEEASSKVESLTKENIDLKEENSTISDQAAEEMKRNKYLKGEVDRMRRSRDQARISRNDKARKLYAQDKLIVSAKRMARMGPRTTYKTFLEAQEEFSKAVEENEKISSETQDESGPIDITACPSREED